MNSILIATIAGLVTAFCWGTSDYLSARSAKSFNPYQISFGLQISASILVALIFWQAGIHVHTSSELFRIIFSSLLVNLAYIVFVKALSGGVVGIIVPLGNIYPVFTLALAVLFQHVRFSVWQVLAIFIIIAGAGLLAYEKNRQRIPLRELHRKTLIALASAVIWGIGFFIVSPVTATVPWQTITIISEIVAIILFTVLLIATSRRRFLRDARKILRNKTILTIGIFGEVGLMALYFGSGHAKSVVIPAVLSTCGPLIASLWGALFEHERLGLVKRIGALVTVAGVVILNIT